MAADKEKKEKKEKKDKTGDGAEKKEKKVRPKRRGDSDEEEMTMWDSVGDIKKTDLTNADNYLKQDKDKALDKRNKDQTANKQAAAKKIQMNDDDASGNTSIVQELLRKKEQEQKTKNAEKEKKKQETEKAKDMFAGLDDAGGEKDRSLEELDLKGDSLVSDKIGNMMEGRVVHDLLATGTFKTLATDADPKLQPSVRNVGSGLVRAGVAAGTKNAEEFLSLGEFTPATGFGFLRCSGKAKKLTFTCARPTTVFFLTMAPTANVDPAVKKWTSLNDNTGERGVETSAGYYGTIKQKKILKPEEQEIEFETTLEESKSLLFFQPDFHAKSFAATEAQENADMESSAVNVGLVVDARNDKTLDEKVEDLKQRQANGEKLTAKEKKMLERHTAETKYHNPDDDAATGDLKAFSIVVPGGQVIHPPSGDSAVCEGFSLAAAGNWLFKNANFKVVQGHRYGFLGPNGMGKTTLLRHIAKRELPVPLDWDILLVEQEAKASNKNVVEEVMASDVKCVELLDEEKALMERLESADDADSKLDAVEMEKTRQRLEEVSAELDARNANALESTVRKILTGLGFTKKMQTQTVETFSGGWRMRISLAKALFLQPKLLLLDEPTNHLDLDAVLWLDNYLSEEYPHTVICVSHDADFLDAICTDVIHLDQQQLFYYRGGYSGFKKMLGQKKLEHARELKKMQDEFKMLKRSGMAKDKAEEQVKKKFNLDSINDIHEKIKDYIVKFNFFGLGQDSGIGGLNVSDVCFSYDGEQPYLLDELDFGCDTTSRIAIVGPNGVGKSTFLNLMLKKLQPCEGEVRHANALRVGHYHQHFDELLPLDKNGVEYLMSDFQKAGISSQEKARASLGQFGLPSFAHLTKIGNLSGGQKARVAFAALSLSQPHIVVLDEPTNHLDIESVEALIDALGRYDGGVILVTHDARLIQAVDCTLWVVALHDPVVKPNTAQIRRHPRGFEGYRQDVLSQLAEREEEIELIAMQRAREREEKRQKLGLAVREVDVSAGIQAKKKANKTVAADDDDDAPAEENADQDASPGNEGGKKKKMTAKERQMLKKEQAKQQAEEQAKKDAEEAEKQRAEAEKEKLLFDGDSRKPTLTGTAGSSDDAAPWIDVPDLDSEDEDLKKKKKKEKKEKKKKSTKYADSDEEAAALEEKKKKKRKRVKYEQSDEEEEEQPKKSTVNDVENNKKSTSESDEVEEKKEDPKKLDKMKKKFDAVAVEPDETAERKSKGKESAPSPSSSSKDEKEEEEPTPKASNSEQNNSEEEDSDSEVDLAAFAKKKAPAAKVEESEEEESDDEVDLAALAKNKKKNFDPPARNTKNKKGNKKSAVVEEEESDATEEITPSKPAPAPPAEPANKASSTSSTSAAAKPAPTSKLTKYKIGKVTSSEAMKKKGTYALEIDVNDKITNETISIVTNQFNDVPSEGAIVVVVPEGEVGPDGKEVKRAKVGGAWNNGLLLSCVHLNIEGTARDVGVLDPDEFEAKVGEYYEMQSSSCDDDAADDVAQPEVVDAKSTSVSEQRKSNASNSNKPKNDSNAGTPGGGKNSTASRNNLSGGNTPSAAATGNPSAPDSDDDDEGNTNKQAAPGQKMGAAAKKRAKKAAAAADGAGDQPQQGGGAAANNKKQRGAANVTLEEEAPINWDSDDGGKKKKGGRKKK